MTGFVLLERMPELNSDRILINYCKGCKYFLYLYNLELDAQQLWLAERKHNKLVTVANKN